MRSRSAVVAFLMLAAFALAAPPPAVAGDDIPPCPPVLPKPKPVPDPEGGGRCPPGRPGCLGGPAR